jgi:hypothetical protein
LKKKLKANETKEIESREAVAQQSDKKETQKAAESTASNVDKEWSADEIKLLVKGVKIIAVGTKDR